MVIGYGSSEWFQPRTERSTPFAAPPITEQRPKRSGGIYIDWGPELPQSYPVNRIAALVRDPFWVCIYWLLDDPDNAPPSDSSIILSVESDESRFDYEVPRICPYWWVKIEPGHRYIARLHTRFGDRDIEFCRTGRFRTPRPWIKSPVTGITPLAADFAQKFGYPIGEAEAIKLSELLHGSAFVGVPPESFRTETMSYPMPRSTVK